MSRVILNLQQSRAERSQQAPIIVDFNGKSHPVNRLSLDAYLEVMEIEGEFAALQKAEANNTADRQVQLAMLMRLKNLVQAALPDFPSGGLELEELMAVAQALQAAVVPDNVSGGGDEPGE